MYQKFRRHILARVAISAAVLVLSCWSVSAQDLIGAPDPLITGNGDAVSFNLGGAVSVGITVSGTFVGTLVPRVAPIGASCTVDASAFLPIASTTAVTSITAPGSWKFQNEGFSQVCLVATAWTSGTATVVATRGYGLLTNVSVDLSGASLSATINAPVGTPLFVRLSNGTTAIDTIPVSIASVPSHAVTNAGTFLVQAAESGTWTVQPGNTANTTAWLVTGAGGTFPISGWPTAASSSAVAVRCVTADATAFESCAGAGGGGSGLTDTQLRATAVPISGTVTANMSSTDRAILSDIADGISVTVTSAPSTAVTNGGTFAVQAAQTGTWTVQPGNTANTTAWLVTGTGGTFPSTQSGTWTVQPGNTANTTAWLVTGAGGVFPVTDNGGSLTVDAPVTTPVFVRLSDGTSAISTLPVSLASVPSHAVTNAGTFAVQATESGTWTVQPGNTANTTAWLVTGAGGTFPITGLPTAATTSAVAVRCVTAAGSAFESCAGAGSTATVQYNEDDAHVTGDKIVAVGFVRKATTPSSTAGTDGDYSIPNVDGNGRLYVNASIYNPTDGSAVTMAGDATYDAAALGTGPQIQFEAKDFTGSALTNTLTVAGHSIRPATTLSGVVFDFLTNKDGSKTPLVDEDTPSANADLLMKIGAIRDDTLDARSGTEGDWEMLHLNANGALWTLDVNSAAMLTALQGATPAGTNLIGQVSSVATATTTNAATPYFLPSAATTNSTNIKASAGNVYNYHLINTTATLYYLRMYNLATAPTCTSSTGFVKTIPIPASTTGSGIVIPIGPGEAFGTGIGFCLTGGGSSTDNTSAATGLYVNIDYK